MIEEVSRCDRFWKPCQIETRDRAKLRQIEMVFLTCIITSLSISFTALAAGSYENYPKESLFFTCAGGSLAAFSAILGCIYIGCIRRQLTKQNTYPTLI